MNTTADWKKIKAEYISTDTSYRKLAEKYAVPFKTLAQRAKKENWVELRNRNTDRVITKMIASEAQKQIKRYERILSVTDRLLDKIEQSIEELDMHMATKTHKTKVIEYDNLDRPDKATKEIIDEVEEIVEYQSIVDKLGLKQVASALRDIKEIQSLKSELDIREQEARIAKLQKESEEEKEETNEVVIRIEGYDESWSQ